MIRLERTNSDNPEFRRVIKKLDADLHSSEYEKVNEYDAMNIIDFLETVVLAFDNDIAVGCGCFKEYDSSSVEIKRMFVDKEQRGKGIAANLLQELEKWAKESGYKNAVLETGKKQLSAIHLYKKSGYSVTENYGSYAGMEDSICMKKPL